MTNKPFGEAWMADYFTMVDRKDPRELVTWYADDCGFRFANQLPARGKPAIVEALNAFYATIRTMRHEKTGCWHDATSGAWEAVAHFELPDGRRFDLPAVSTLRLRNGLIADFRFVMDASPLQQR